MKEHISNIIEENKSKIKKHCKWIYNVLDKKTINKNINKKKNDYEKFKKDINSISLTTEGINPERVLEKYFKIIPPFENRKRNEFKDALFVETIFKYIENNPEKNSYVVITNDKGIKEALKFKKSKKLFQYDSIEDFIDSELTEPLISKEELEFALNQFDFSSQIEKLANIITSDMEEEEINIDSIEFHGIYFPKIIKQEANKLTIACDMNIGLFGYFKCLDYDNSYYSKEKDEYLHKEYIERPFFFYFCQTIIEVTIKNDKTISGKIIDLADIEITYYDFIGR